MFLAALILILIIGAAFFIVRKFGGEIFDSKILALAASVPFGIAATSALGSLLNLFLNTYWAMGLALGGFILFGFYCGLNSGNKKAVEKLSVTWYNRTIGGGVLVVLIFLSLNQLKTLPSGSLSLAPFGSYDTVYHLAQIWNMAGQSHWQFGSPYFAGETINYPFFINFFSAALLKFSGSLYWSFHLPLLVLFASITILLFGILEQQKIKPFLWPIIILTTFFGGGLAFLNHAYFELLPSQISYPLQPIDYQSLATGFLLFQRTFVLGLALFFAATYSSFKYVENPNQKNMWWSVLLGALLGFSHTHSLIAFGIFLSAFSVFYGLSKTTQGKKWLMWLGIFLLLSLPQILLMLVLPKYPLGHGFLIRLGWETDPGMTGGIKLPYPGAGKFLPWVNLMLVNFGPLLLLPVIFLLIGIFNPKILKAKVVGITSLGLWLFPNIIQPQAWDFDTNKLFSYAIFFSLLWAGLEISQITRARAKYYLAMAFVLLLIPSSFSAFYKIYLTVAKSPQRPMILSPAQAEAANWLKNNSADDAAIVSDSFTLPLSESFIVGAASGRQNSAAFIQWLYAHDVNFMDREEKVATFLKNPVSEALPKDIPADYLIIDEMARRDFPEINSDLKKMGLKPAFNNIYFQIYKLWGDK